MCRLGGSNFGGDTGRQQPPKLIIPGQDAGSGRPGGGTGGGLVTPGAPGSGGRSSGMGMGAPSPDTPFARNFRPPPGFMDKDGEDKDTLADASPQDMLNRLQAQAGHWHQLAKLLPALHTKGFDSFTVEEATGLERKTQNLWTSSASIYDGLKKSGQVEPSVLSYFDTPGAEVLLHELRFLSLRQRISAVKYITEYELDDADCTILARAMKEHERRSGEREGFSNSPRDCLAYKYYRDALEYRRPEDARSCAEKGLALVESEQGRAKLAEIVREGAPGAVAEAVFQAQLTVMRLEKDEVGCRPIALIGDFVIGGSGTENKGSTTVANRVRTAPKVSSEGPFGIFSLPEQGASWHWVPLPAWPIVSLAARPVALQISNCADLVALQNQVQAKSEEEVRKLQGPGLLIVDAKNDLSADSISPEVYYLVECGGDGGVDVSEGSAVTDVAKVLGPVLFLCRPPAREILSTHELLSL